MTGLCTGRCVHKKVHEPESNRKNGERKIGRFGEVVKYEHVGIIYGVEFGEKIMIWPAKGGRNLRTRNMKQGKWSNVGSLVGNHCFCCRRCGGASPMQA